MSNDEQVREVQSTDAESGSADAAARQPASAANETESAGAQAAVQPDAADATTASDTQDETVDGSLTEQHRLLTRVSELEAEVAELTDTLLRKTADFDNYRKRMLREKEEFAAFANRELLLDIVSIIDDFERAIRSADESHDFTAFHDGIVMIEKQFTSMLERKWELTRFDSVGEEFDPLRHEAMMTEDRADHEHSIVLDDFQKGYLLHEKVLRPAKVKVSMPGGADAPPQE